jgi:hypothetical protein
VAGIVDSDLFSTTADVCSMWGDADRQTNRFIENSIEVLLGGNGDASLSLQSSPIPFPEELMPLTKFDNYQDLHVCSSSNAFLAFFSLNTTSKDIFDNFLSIYLHCGVLPMLS